MIPVTQEDILLFKQHTQEIHIRALLLNNKFQIIDTLQGELVSGSVSIDAESDIRRTLNVSFYVRNKTYLSNTNSKIWLDKQIEVHYGIKSLRTNDIRWFKMGTYLLNGTNFSYDSSTKSLSLSCVDLMANFTGMRNGVLFGYNAILPAGTNIKQQIISMLTAFGNTYKYIIEEDEYPPNRLVPYELRFAGGTTIHRILNDVKELYPAWEMFVDLDNTFVFQKIPTCESDIVVVDDYILNEIVISENSSYNWESIKNSIQGFGWNGISTVVKLVDKIPSIQEDNTFYVVNPDNPFTIDKIGEVKDNKSGDRFAKIPSVELLRKNLQYELFHSTNMQSTLSLTTTIIPFLDVNTKFEFTSKMTNEKHQYIIKKINFDLGNCTQTIECIRFYNQLPQITT